LSLRPFEKWYESYYSTIFQSHYPSEERKAEMDKKVAASPQLQAVMPVMAFAKQSITEDHFQGRFLDKEFMEKIFNDHNEEVKNYVPANRLLVFDVREGWEPLCAFLGVKVPDEPLPHTNKKEDFAAMVGELMKGHMA
ncbi:MAG: sulfotransferase family protein, partial [Parafilimonas sp.]